LACKTSADLFDLGKDDFLEGVEIMLAGDFMRQATGSDLHLMFWALPSASDNATWRGVTPGRSETSLVIAWWFTAWAFRWLA
jgi:hypothetical protein